MGEKNWWGNIKEFICGLAWDIYLWGLGMSEEDYWGSVYEQRDGEIASLSKEIGRLRVKISFYDSVVTLENPKLYMHKSGEAFPMPSPKSFKYLCDKLESCSLCRAMREIEALTGERDKLQGEKEDKGEIQRRN